MPKAEKILGQVKVMNIQIFGTKKVRGRTLLEEYNFADKDLMERFEFRNIRQDEADQAIAIEQICFPPNEACSPKAMKERVED